MAPDRLVDWEAARYCSRIRGRDAASGQVEGDAGPHNPGADDNDVRRSPNPPGLGIWLRRTDAHPDSALDLPQQPRGELLVRRVAFLHDLQHLVVDVGQHVQELALVHPFSSTPEPWLARWSPG